MDPPHTRRFTSGFASSRENARSPILKTFRPPTHTALFQRRTKICGSRKTHSPARMQNMYSIPGWERFLVSLKLNIIPAKKADLPEPLMA